MCCASAWDTGCQARRQSELIAEDKTPYYRALETADESFAKTDAPDLTAMEALIEGLLAKQLVEVFKKAKGGVTQK